LHQLPILSATRSEAVGTIGAFSPQACRGLPQLALSPPLDPRTNDVGSDKRYPNGEEGTALMTGSKNTIWLSDSLITDGYAAIWLGTSRWRLTKETGGKPFCGALEP
jgi:hypothetical protein